MVNPKNTFKSDYIPAIYCTLLALFNEREQREKSNKGVKMYKRAKPRLTKDIIDEIIGDSFGISAQDAGEIRKCLSIDGTLATTDFLMRGITPEAEPFFYNSDDTLTNYLLMLANFEAPIIRTDGRTFENTKKLRFNPDSMDRKLKDVDIDLPPDVMKGISALAKCAVPATELSHLPEVQAAKTFFDDVMSKEYDKFWNIFFANFRQFRFHENFWSLLTQVSRLNEETVRKKVESMLTCVPSKTYEEIKQDEREWQFVLNFKKTLFPSRKQRKNAKNPEPIKFSSFSYIDCISMALHAEHLHFLSKAPFRQCDLDFIYYSLVVLKKEERDFLLGEISECTF